MKFTYDRGEHDFGDGTKAVARTERDDDMGPPWKEHDGHGPVSDWTTRNKRPGERLLHSDGGSKRYYDFAEAMRIAKRDGWGLGEKDMARLTHRLGRTPTKGEVTAAAVEQDFERLRGWCNDRWHWIGVIVKLEDADGRLIAQDSLWGIEGDTDYWQEVAAEIAERLHGEHVAEQAERQHWAERDTITLTSP